MTQPMPTAAERATGLLTMCTSGPGAIRTNLTSTLASHAHEAQVEGDTVLDSHSGTHTYSPPTVDENLHFQIWGLGLLAGSAKLAENRQKSKENDHLGRASSVASVRPCTSPRSPLLVVGG